MVITSAKTCRLCGQTLTRVEPVIVCGRSFVLEPTVCATCSEAGAIELQRNDRSRWEQLCPELYQCTAIGRLENNLRRQGYSNEWVQEVLVWQYGPQGVLLIGPTGVGKSRVMWILLRRILDQEHRSGAFLNAVKFRTGLQTAAREGATEEFVRRLVRTDVMYWDDWGQTHLTGSTSEMLLHLVEERTCAGKPILATTQYSGEKMDAQFDRKEMGQAVRRRLNEFCKVVIVREECNRLL
jgi:DNA replication protein DnaC